MCISTRLDLPKGGGTLVMVAATCCGVVFGIAVAIVVAHDIDIVMIVLVLQSTTGKSDCARKSLGLWTLHSEDR
jgi:hypothetical protein